jgi:hypothetical protein
MAANPRVYPDPDPRIQINGTIWWTCPHCGQCHKTRVQHGKWHIQCYKCQREMIIGSVMGALPPGPFRAPIDVAIPADLKRSAIATESYAGEGDGPYMRTEWAEFKSGGRVHRTRELAPGPPGDATSDAITPK